MRSVLLIILFTVFGSTLSHGRVGLAEAIFTTPGNHQICHCDPYKDSETPVLIGQDSLIQLNKWYFYKQNIIGQGNGYYFIFNEVNEQLQYFKNKELWENAIEVQNLNPTILRWLDLSDSPDDFLFFLFLISFIAVPVVLLLIILILILTFKKVIVLNRKKVVFLCSILLIPIILSILQLFPESF